MKRPQGKRLAPSADPAAHNTLNKSPVRLRWQDKHRLPSHPPEKPVRPRGAGVHFPPRGDKDNWWFIKPADAALGDKVK